MKTLSTLALSLSLAATSAFADGIVLTEVDHFDWEVTTEGVAFAPLQGDRFVEAYQAMVRLPAGIVSPPHVKSANMFGVMLQGEMIHYELDADPAEAQPIGAGGFYTIPRGLPHVSACVSTVPCVAYLYQDGAFDFVPVQ
ncbi:MAG: DUF4437 domain-containing protein [Pseudomonadota bacterium]